MKRSSMRRRPTLRSPHAWRPMRRRRWGPRSSWPSISTSCISSIRRAATAWRRRVRLPPSTTTVGRLLRLPLRVVPRERPVRILGGPLRGWRWVPAAASHGCWLGTFERAEQDVFARTIRPGDVVYDLGANVGFYPLLAEKLPGPRGALVGL